MKIKIPIILFLTLFVAIKFVNAQLFISSGSTFHIQSGGTVTVQGDVTSSSDITGPGKVILKGSANQNVNMNGFTVPNLEMDNAANATLTGNLRIGTDVTFTTGKIQQGNFDAFLASTATATGAGTDKFFETNGTGFLRKELTADVAGTNLPVGAGADYMPVAITTSGSTYASANVGAQVKGIVSANKHPLTESYLLANWPISKVGITGGTTNAVGTYVDPTRVVGAESELNGFFWNGTNWSLIGSNQNAIINTAGATITTNNGNLYAMNKFVLVNTKAYLQAAYNTSTPGLMDDKLRTTAAYVIGGAPTGNIIPTSDPYRTGVTLPASFSRVNNNIPETVANAAVFNDQSNAAKNVVDWVFLELRNSGAAPTTVLATRSALLLRDGSIVDMDGISPVYFKNVGVASNPSEYITVRHRNHLGIRSLNATTLDIIGSPVPTTIDLSVNAASLFNSFGANIGGSGIFGLYGGNSNSNNSLRITGATSAISDLEKIKSVLGTSPLISNIYSEADVNMNRIVRITGATAAVSDLEFIKSILGTSPLISQPTF
ncbi:MAG: hypothetical protein ABL929_07065 [Ferruginibacter sp.]|nr:hypothetical protein [Ferruginibacter sp.]